MNASQYYFYVKPPKIQYFNTKDRSMGRWNQCCR